MEYSEIENYLKKLTFKEPDESFRAAVIGAGKEAWHGETECFGDPSYDVFRFRSLSYACTFILVILVAYFAFLWLPISKTENLDMGEFYRVLECYIMLRQDGEKVFEPGKLPQPFRTGRIQLKKTAPVPAEKNQGERGSRQPDTIKWLSLNSS